MLHWTGVAGRCAAGIALVFVAAIAVLPAPARAQSAGGVPEIRIHLRNGHESYDEPVRAAAQLALATYTEWLGPLPVRSVTIVERPWCGEVPDAPAQTIVDVPWWPAPARMDLEAQVADGIARQWWPSLLREAQTRPVVLGIAWYLQSRVVEDLFNREFFLTAHSADSVRLFGGAVPRVFRALPLGRWSAGLGRAAFLQTADRPPPACRATPDFDATTPRVALAFGTLERYIGWPALQGALRALAAQGSKQMTRSEIRNILSAAAGQDLSWFFDAVFNGRRFAYRVRSLSTATAASPCGFPQCFQTRVVVGRDGDAVFSGSSRAGEGPYTSGDAMELRVEFADGQHVSTRWSGRDASRTFEFESGAPATAAHLDPDRVLLLDDNYLDNAQLTQAESNVPITKWVARWMVWAQDAMLTYAF